MTAALAALRAAAPGLSLSVDPLDLAPHLTDWRGAKTGAAAALLLPSETAHVQAIARVAARHRVPLVPQGGNTGLVGGGVPEADGDAWLVSMRRMAGIRAIDPAGLSMIVEAGATLQSVHDAAAAQGLVFPLSLGAKGSATIGGLIATNAGGTQVLRHGTMRGLVLGLEAVLADGSRLDQLSPLRKDNTGYDVKQLLIGAEGTLGIVTAAALKLSPAPMARAVAWAGTSSPAFALALLARLRAAAGEVVESFELIPEDGLDLVLRHIPGTRAPLADAHRWHLLIELAGPPSVRETLAEALAAGLDAGEIADATLAESGAQAAALWRLREELPEAERRDGPAVKNDVAVRVADVPRFHDAAVAAVARAAPGARAFAFGHLGDGNLHLNFRPPQGADGAAWVAAHAGAVRRALHDAVAAHGGSISAEHGIGTLKSAELARLADPAKLAAMRAIKAALDPLGIMNPGKVFA